MLIAVVEMTEKHSSQATRLMLDVCLELDTVVSPRGAGKHSPVDPSMSPASCRGSCWTMKFGVGRPEDAPPAGSRDSGPGRDLHLPVGSGQLGLDGGPHRRLAFRHPGLPHRVHRVEVADVGQPHVGAEQILLRRSWRGPAWSARSRQHPGRNRPGRRTTRCRCRRRPDSGAGWSCVVRCASLFPFPRNLQAQRDHGVRHDSSWNSAVDSGEPAVRLVPGRTNHVQGYERYVERYDGLGVVEADPQDRLELL
jgi:hypothetical protein